jgi:hypothetical protein
MQVFTFDSKKDDLAAATATYMGIAHELKDPFHLAVKIDDLNKSSVKVIIYSLGTKREVLWGWYYPKTRMFEWSSGCKFKISLLGPFLKSWNAVGITTVADFVKNRIYEVINEITGSVEGITRNEYIALKYIINYFNKKIDYETLEAELIDFDLMSLINKLDIHIESYPEISQDIDYEFDINKLKPYVKTINIEIQKYESNLNLITIDRDILHDLVAGTDTLKQMIFDFQKEVEYGKYNTSNFYNSLSECISETECAKLGFNPEPCDIFDFIIDRSDELL